MLFFAQEVTEITEKGRINILRFLCYLLLKDVVKYLNRLFVLFVFFVAN